VVAQGILLIGCCRPLCSVGCGQSACVGESTIQFRMREIRFSDGTEFFVGAQTQFLCGLGNNLFGYEAYFRAVMPVYVTQKTIIVCSYVPLSFPMLKAKLSA